jgi:5-methylcytosine-specific restriction endonuclease McrA
MAYLNQICSVCKENKPLANFHKNKNYKTGHSVTCKVCAKIRSKAWQQNNPDRVNANYRKNYALHLDYSRQKRRERVRRWYSKNSEKARMATALYYQKYPERRRINENKRRTAKIGNGIFFISPKDLNRILSSSCYKCGKIDNVTLDHIIPISRGGRHSVGNLQPLCKSCNSSKGSKTMTEWKHSKRMLGVG